MTDAAHWGAEDGGCARGGAGGGIGMVGAGDGGVTAGGAVTTGCVSAFPQLEQNRWPSSLGVWQTGQMMATYAPSAGTELRILR